MNCSLLIKLTPRVNDYVMMTYIMEYVRLISKIMLYKCNEYAHVVYGILRVGESYES